MFIPHHIFATADGAAPSQWMFVLHGIFGRGSNWRTFARNLARRRPDWGMVLVDLRMHGASRAAPPPHTVAAAADDLVALASELDRAGKPVRGVLGHSFGGKVALAYRGRATDALAHTWVIDASPSARPHAMDDPQNTVAFVLKMLAALPTSFPDRDAFVAAVVDHGFAAPLGHWLAMNLDRQGDVYVSSLDLAAIEALLRDYYRLDFWPRVSAGPGEAWFVVAGKSDAVSAADRARLDELASSGAHAIEIAEAGHWVHIEAPGRLLDIVADRLPA